MENVILFIDYQNVYHLARNTFFRSGDPKYKGQVNPLALANHLIEKNRQIRIERGFQPQILKQIRIYTGIPSSIAFNNSGLSLCACIPKMIASISFVIFSGNQPNWLGEIPAFSNLRNRD